MAPCQQDGSYPEGSVNFLVHKRLGELAGSLKGFYAQMLNDGAEWKAS